MARVAPRSFARAPLAPEDVARIGAALADAIHSVHLQDVIHLDIKPENFLLRPTGEAVLLDFGFARHARYPDLLAEEKEFAAGSAAYVSPEQLQHDRGDLRSDLFALGVLLYELATGAQPFGQPETPPACATGYGDARRRLARSIRHVPPGCRRSFCVASSPLRARAINRPRTSRSIFVTPSRLR